MIIMISVIYFTPFGDLKNLINLDTLIEYSLGLNVILSILGCRGHTDTSISF